MKTPKSISKKIAERKAENAFRFLSFQDGGNDFSSNDYLGIARMNNSGIAPHGSTGSRLISGNHSLHEAFEEEAASFFGMPAGLLFNSGYDANLGFFSSVPQRGDIILYDSFIHASIRDGFRMSFARSFSFLHNNIADLKKKLAQYAGTTVYVVVESVYSMDGDEAPLKEIINCCLDENIFLIVDEAHAGGIYGTHGEGLVSSLGLNDHVFAKLITFGKAYGSHGGLVLGNEELRHFLINFSRPFIYTTALPPSSVERLRFALDLVGNSKDRRKELHERITFFQKEIKKTPLSYLISTSPIQGVVISGNNEVRKKSEELQEKGFFVKPILSPTVPKGKERLRICLHSYNSISSIQELINTIK